MALAKQQFFFPFFLFANSRYILPGPVYASYDLLSPLSWQSYPIKITVWDLGRAEETLSVGYSLHSECRGSSCLCGRWNGSSPSLRASLAQSIPPAEHPSFRWEQQQQQAANKGLPTIQPGARSLNYPSHPPAKKNVLLRKERIRCCSTEDGIVWKQLKVLNRQPRVWNGLCFKV